MIDTSQILRDLDKHAAEFNFPVLDNAYVEFAAARLTAFRSGTDWATLFEVLGFSNREITFVDDVYAYGSCMEKEGFTASYSPVTNVPEEPVIDPATNQCVADWAKWTIVIGKKRITFNPTPEEYRKAGITDLGNAGPGSLSEISLLRFLVHRLGEGELFLNDRELLSNIPKCIGMKKFIQTTAWRHPDIAAEEKPSSNEAIRSLLQALHRNDASLFVPGSPNTRWDLWG